MREGSQALLYEAPVPDYTWSVRLGFESSNSDSQIPTLSPPSLLTGQCGYSAEGWKIVEDSGDMGGEVGSVCIFKRSMEAEANHSLRRQPVEGFLGEGGN